MKVTEAVILAGGLGTRLRSAVPELPKCMAPVAGKPFISYVIDYYLEQGIEKFIFSLGYKHELVEEYLSDHYTLLEKVYAIEEEPLGTGGAIKLAGEEVSTNDVLVLNGDTLFKISVEDLAAVHEQKKSMCTIALKPMSDINRYGVVELDNNASVKNFREKKFYKEGTINGGVYLVDMKRFMALPYPEKFSFENDFLEKIYKTNEIHGVMQDEYFIDIGIPEDFERAQDELKVKKR